MKTKKRMFAGCDRAGLEDLYEHAEDKEAFLIALKQFKSTQSSDKKVKNSQRQAAAFLKELSKKAPKKITVSHSEIMRAFVEAATESALDEKTVSQWSALARSSWPINFKTKFAQKLGFAL